MKNVLILCCILSAASPAAPGAPGEVWAYLMKGEEAYFPADSPITDVACFSAEVNRDGRLQGGHSEPPHLDRAKPGTRYHLVVTLPWNTSLAHIFLSPDLPFRDRIIADIVERSKRFNGVQIDFESISAEDRAAYLDFLTALKKALPDEKLFSVAVMARWAEHKSSNPDDAFDYPLIGRIADRVVVMAYDEHYRGGAPGPIASLPWCSRIYSYARNTIHPGKLVMGIPLYGRSWQTPSTARAYRNPEVVDELLSKGIRSTWDPATGGTYTYQETVTMTVYYETAQSINAKLDLYLEQPVRGVAFWRIGQEPRDFWTQLKQRTEVTE